MAAVLGTKVTPCSSPAVLDFIRKHLKHGAPQQDFEVAWWCPHGHEQLGIEGSHPGVFRVYPVRPWGAGRAQLNPTKRAKLKAFITARGSEAPAPADGDDLPSPADGDDPSEHSEGEDEAEFSAEDVEFDVSEPQPVVETTPEVEPFPTIFWIACPSLRAYLGALEASGLMEAIRAELRGSEAMQRALWADHRACIEERWQMLNERDRQWALERRSMHFLFRERGIGGMSPGSVRCLHAMYAHHLVRGNAVGAWLDAHEAEAQERVGETSSWARDCPLAARAPAAPAVLDPAVPSVTASMPEFDARTPSFWREAPLAVQTGARVRTRG